MSDFFTAFDDEAPTGIRGVAGQLNLRYIDSVRDRSYKEEVSSQLGGMALLADADLERSVSDLAYGTFAGYPLQIFTYDAVTYRDEPNQTKRSCVLFEVPFRLPNIAVAPHNRLSAARQGRVNPASFEAKYRVTTRDVESAKLIFDDAMRDWFATLDPPLRLELSAQRVLAHIGLCPPEDIPKLVTTVFSFVIRIPDDAFVRFGGHH